jgi:hypothetical protein
MPMIIIENRPNLENFGNVVPEGYMYYHKFVSPAEDLSLPSAYLKFYKLYPDDAPITEEQLKECRAFITEEASAGHLKLEQELGFIILHRAGKYLLLMLMTWRNTNEIWESVWAKEADSSTPYNAMQYPSSHRGTFCVWELLPVMHERHAWTRFLSSKRDNDAKLAYINDRFSGRV